ncbi:22_t:CDS:2 [Cetraspora pellucida]|uniref:22_t:CDS:1 n=1 Tax=Cetraspora pellucida TaxID=1433469 RepID=A0A9N9FK27_9GLOM|nr:22_t:CDS:2 [Cetraspora pellucida]
MGNDVSKKNTATSDKDPNLDKSGEIKFQEYIKANTGFPSIDSNLDKEYHHNVIILKAWGSNFFSPIESTLKDGDAKVLDIGCGFGTWVCDMAKTYPLSHFTGIDIVNRKDVMPSNVCIEQADVLKELQYLDCSFDYIHIKDILWSISSKDAQTKLFPELLRILKPGGWIENVEFDMKVINPGPNTKFLADALFSFLRNKGVCSEDFYKNAVKLFKDNNLEYQFDERILYFTDHDEIKQKFITFFEVVKSMILEYTSISYKKYDEMLDKSSVELDEYNTSFRLIRHFGKKL